VPSKNVTSGSRPATTTRADRIHHCRESDIRRLPSITVLLMAISLLALPSAAAQAASPARTAPEPQVAQAGATQDFAIPSQQLSAALDSFANRAGLSFAYKTGDISSLRSPGVTGTMTVEDALRRLLAGTGITYRFTGQRTVTLTLATAGDGRALQLDPVTVEGTAEPAAGPIDGYVASRSVSATKTDTPLVEVPQAISVVTRDQIVDQGAQSVSQALRYTPGVFVEPNGGSSRYDEIRIRGFTPVQYLDGMQVALVQFFATPQIEPYGLERIEALKGPSSGLYGESAPGGLLHLVTKRPTETPFRELEMKVGTFDLWQLAGDFSGPIDDAGQFLFRFTGLFRDADTIVDFTRDNRRFVAPALTWRTKDRDTQFTLLASYGGDDGTYPHQYLPAQGTLLPNPHGEIPESRFAGEPGFDTFERDQYSIGYAFSHKFDDIFSVCQNMRYSNVDTFFRAFRSEGLQADLETLNRSAFSQKVDANTLTIDNQVQANFTTAMLAHKMLGGLDYVYTEGDYDVKFAFGAVPTLNIFDPQYGSDFPVLSDFLNTHQERDQLGIYFQDQIKLASLALTGSVRYDWASSETDNLLTFTTTKQDDEALTGRVGLSYMFDAGIVPYASYATSFQPQSGTDSAGQPFQPTTGEQVEVGVKYQMNRTNSLITLAAFDLTQKNILTPDPADPVNFNVQTGEIKVRGIEVEARTEFFENVELIGSYAFLDSEVTKSNNASELGRRVPLTPEHQGSIWANYSFSSGVFKGLQIGGGMRYVGTTFSETTSANPLKIPAYMLFDAAVHYDLGELLPIADGAELSINATNLLDNYHVTYCFGTSYCSLGASRTVFGTIRYRW